MASGDLPFYLAAPEALVGYCVPISSDTAVTAAHCVVNPRLINPRLKFRAGQELCEEILVADDADVCLVTAPTASWNAAAVFEGDVPLESRGSLRGLPVDFRDEGDTEVLLGWRNDLERGMSGSGVYAADDRLIAVLSRIKRGEYAVAVKVSPFLD